MSALAAVATVSARPRRERLFAVTGTLPAAWAGVDDAGEAYKFHLGTRIVPRGNGGSVYRGTCAQHGPVAVKFFDVLEKERARREIRLATAIGEPHVVPTLYSHMGRDPQAFLVMPLLPEGTVLHDHVVKYGPVTGRDLWALAIGLWESVAACAAATDPATGAPDPVLHRDIKPQNVTVDGRLFDFGLARSEQSTLLTQKNARLGTRCYMSPEASSGESLTTFADVYSTALTILFAATGAHPWPGATDDDGRDALRRAGPPPMDGLPYWLPPLLAPALAVEPRERPTAAELATSWYWAEDSWLATPERAREVAVAAAHVAVGCHETAGWAAAARLADEWQRDGFLKHVSAADVLPEHRDAAVLLDALHTSGALDVTGAAAAAEGLLGHEPGFAAKAERALRAWVDSSAFDDRPESLRVEELVGTAEVAGASSRSSTARGFRRLHRIACGSVAAMDVGEERAVALLSDGSLWSTGACSPIRPGEHPRGWAPPGTSLAVTDTYAAYVRGDEDSWDGPQLHFCDRAGLRRIEIGGTPVTLHAVGPHLLLTSTRVREKAAGTPYEHMVLEAEVVVMDPGKVRALPSSGEVGSLGDAAGSWFFGELTPQPWREPVRYVQVGARLVALNGSRVAVLDPARAGARQAELKWRAFAPDGSLDEPAPNPGPEPDMQRSLRFAAATPTSFIVSDLRRLSLIRMDARGQLVVERTVGGMLLAVHDDVVVVDDAERTWGLALGSGRALWSIESQRGYLGSYRSVLLYGPPTGETGGVFGIDAMTGSHFSVAALDAEAVHAANSDVNSSYRLEGSVLAVKTDTALYGLHPLTGARLWSLSTPDLFLGDAAFSRTHVAAPGIGGRGLAVYEV